MEDYYREVILDHYRHPRNAGTLDPADIHAVDSNPLCGDKVELFLKLGEDGRVSAVRFSGRGCAISQASASLLTEMIEGQTLEELKGYGKREVLEALGLTSISPARMKCAMLSLRVLHQALGDTDWFTRDEEQ
jgi:nitrogen fixation NifU-like protein